MKLQKYLFLPAALLMVAVVSMAFVTDAAQHDRTVVVPAVESSVLVNDDGEELYMTRCLSCHMTNGEGVPGVFPPLTESEYVTGDKGRLIRMILNGLSGEIVVNDVTYSSDGKLVASASDMMPPWGGFLNDEQVADVLTYIRESFGNDADAITTDEVARVRAVVADRKDTWTIDELNQEENLGIPDGD